MTKPIAPAVFSDFGTVWRCDVCGKPRSAGRHTSCSRERQKRLTRDNTVQTGRA